METMPAPFRTAGVLPRFHVCETEGNVDVPAKEVSGPFCGGNLTEEGLLVLVLTVLDDKFTYIGHDENSLRAG